MKKSTMGRQGPCRHCHIETSRHWRGGPPEKPVLCNTCGCRWAKEHQLDGYVPRHSNVPKYEMEQLSSTGKPHFSTASSEQKKQGSSRMIQDLTAKLTEQLQSGVLDQEQFAQASPDYDDNFIYKPKWMTPSNETLLGAVLHTPPAKE